jgi:hypothetical protein
VGGAHQATASSNQLDFWFSGAELTCIFDYVAAPVLAFKGSLRDTCHLLAEDGQPALHPVVIHALPANGHFPASSK